MTKIKILKDHITIGANLITNIWLNFWMQWNIL